MKWKLYSEREFEYDLLVGWVLTSEVNSIFGFFFLFCLVKITGSAFVVVVVNADVGQLNSMVAGILGNEGEGEGGHVMQKIKGRATRLLRTFRARRGDKQTIVCRTNNCNMK